MTATINKAQLLGRLGRDPERREFQQGGSIVTLSIATSEVWRDQSGQRQERTDWHTVSILNEAIGKTAMAYLRKGSSVYVEGPMRTRVYTDNKQVERRVTELVVPKFGGDMKLMDPRQDDAARQSVSGKDRAAGDGRDDGGLLDDHVPY